MSLITDTSLTGRMRFEIILESGTCASIVVSHQGVSASTALSHYA